jgi:hypothetical protein
VCRVVGAPGKEPNHHYTFQGARMGLGWWLGIWRGRGSGCGSRCRCGCGGSG